MQLATALSLSSFAADEQRRAASSEQTSSERSSSERTSSEQEEKTLQAVLAISMSQSALSEQQVQQLAHLPAVKKKPKSEKETTTRSLDLTSTDIAALAALPSRKSADEKNSSSRKRKRIVVLPEGLLLPPVHRNIKDMSLEQLMQAHEENLTYRRLLDKRIKAFENEDDYVECWERLDRDDDPIVERIRSKRVRMAKESKESKEGKEGKEAKQLAPAAAAIAPSSTGSSSHSSELKQSEGDRKFQQVLDDSVFSFVEGYIGRERKEWQEDHRAVTALIEQQGKFTVGTGFGMADNGKFWTEYDQRRKQEARETKARADKAAAKLASMLAAGVVPPGLPPIANVAGAAAGAAAGAGAAAQRPDKTTQEQWEELLYPGESLEDMDEEEDEPDNSDEGDDSEDTERQQEENEEMHKLRQEMACFVRAHDAPADLSRLKHMELVSPFSSL